MRNLILSILLAISAVGVGLYFYLRIDDNSSAQPNGQPNSQGPTENITLYAKIPKALESAFEKKNPDQLAEAALVTDGGNLISARVSIDYLPGRLAMKLNVNKWLLEQATSIRIVGWETKKGGINFSTQLAPFKEARKPNSPRGLFVYVQRHLGIPNKPCLPGKEKPAAVSMEIHPTREMKNSLHRERKYLFLILHLKGGATQNFRVTNLGMREVKGSELFKSLLKVNVPLIPNHDKVLQGPAGVELFLFVDCSRSKTGSCSEAAANYVGTNEFMLVPKGYVATQSFCGDQSYKFVLAPSNSNFAASVEAEMNKLN